LLGKINSLNTTAGKKTLFIKDYFWDCLQISLETHKTLHHFHTTGDSPSQTTTTPDNQYVFVSGTWELEQWHIKTHTRVKKYIFNSQNKSVATTFDNKHVFVGLQDGSLWQICVKGQTVIRDYGKILEFGITSIAVTRDGQFLVVAGHGAYLAKISIGRGEIVKNFG
jgi:DNA-binding beta-propeller fold protein YncE